jgi:hypothetical protein
MNDQNTAWILANEEGRWLVLRVFTDRETHPDQPYGSESAWRTEVCDAASPLAGLFAFGASLAESRAALAALAWQAIAAGELAPVTTADLAGIKVFTISRKTFRSDGLTEAVVSEVA